MDPVTVIVAALGAGAGLGVKDTASQAVMDAYVGLKALVSRRLSGRQTGELVLARHERAPGIWEKPLAEELLLAGAAGDGDLIRAAQALLSLVDAAGTASGKYRVTVEGSQGVQVGDHNTMTVNLGLNPDQ